MDDESDASRSSIAQAVRSPDRPSTPTGCDGLVFHSCRGEVQSSAGSDWSARFVRLAGSAPELLPPEEPASAEPLEMLAWPLRSLKSK